MPKLGVEELKILLAEAEEKGKRMWMFPICKRRMMGAVLMDPRVIGGVRVAQVCQILIITSSLKKKYCADDKRTDRSVPARHRTRTSDRTLGYDDIRTLVTSFAGN